jgi:antibiotic biosynthesis monooxygenase (ABM) superfamily enzyme
VDESVTTTAVHSVAYGREEDFYAWANSLFREAEKSADFLGGGILGSPEAGGEWHVIYRWVDAESARWWEETATRAGWMDAADSFAYPIQVQEITGLRAWFEKRAAPAVPPPKWKMALVTLTAVFPPVLLFNVTLIPRLLGLPVVLRTLALCVGVTVIVTWVMMPRLLRLLRGWLNPPVAQQPSRPQARYQQYAREPLSRAPAMANSRPMMDGGPGQAYRPSGRYPAPKLDKRSHEPPPRPVAAPTEQESAPTNPEPAPTWHTEEIRMPRSDVPPALNLVRNGDSGLSRTRRLPPRDLRSPYLRRETG